MLIFEIHINLLVLRLLMREIIVSYFILNKILILLIYLLGESEASQASQSTITSLFNRQLGQRDESFTISHFKKLLLSFIINNNISFRAITIPSFKKLLSYLNK
jgi:hypothetical protein